MAPPRVFISHSCKDAELAAPPPADVAGLARRARLAYARSLRALVKERLESIGVEVCLDVDRLEPGDEWRAKLHFWLETCDAAIVLLNPEAVASPWVRKEVDILMHRWTVARSFESDVNKRLRIVPVFLGGFADADIRAAGFGDLEILSVQAARLMNPDLSEANATELAGMVVEALSGLTPVTRDGHLRRWLNNVVAGLDEVRRRGDTFLDEGRKRSGVGDADWANPATRVEILAHHLLHCDLPTVKAALAEMRPAFLNVQEYQAFAARLLPLWVDESVARGLVDTHTTLGAGIRNDQAGGTARAVGLNAGQFDTVRDYINRAWGYPSWGSRCIDFEPPLGENAEHDVLTALYRALAPLTRAKPVTNQILTNFLARDPFFVTIGTEMQPSEALLEQLAATYPTVTFVVLGGTDFTAVAEGDVVARVQPFLLEGVEDTAAAMKAEILQLQ